MAPSSSDLFEHAAQQNPSGRPLAERMRPKELGHMLGQEALLGPTGALTRWVAAKQALSLIIWGPPGSGKTTLAHALAKAHGVQLTTLSAVSAGVKDIREVVEAARLTRNHYSRSTWLFIDEIHRFNRGQQDALLPHVEAGLFTLIGATTQNPAFEVNGALLSRCRVIKLEPLGPQAAQALLKRALADKTLGLGHLRLQADDAVLGAIVRHSDGDARRALGTLEAAAALAHGGGRTTITADDVAQGAQDRWIAHDRDGEAHYKLLSALIKSMRYGDADAAVYYLARLLEAGEPPRTVIRRMVIFASEDIGPKDPSALALAMAAFDAFELMGMPEGTLPLTQLAIHLAQAGKSRMVVDAYSRAAQAVHDYGPLPVPNHLCNPGGQPMQPLGHGRAKHAHAGGPKPTNHLPQALQHEQFVRPS
jgi:putative ATPase